MKKRTAGGFIHQIAERLDIDEQEVRKIVNSLRKYKGPLWGLTVDNRDHFTDLRNWAQRGLEILQKMPDHVLFAIFASEVSETLDTMPDEAHHRLNEYLIALGNIHDRCDQLIALWKPGVRGGFRWREHKAAIEAGLLLVKHGKPIKKSKDGDFYVVAGLLFQAAWGEPAKEMRRACEAVLRAVPIRTKWERPPEPYGLGNRSSSRLRSITAQPAMCWNGSEAPTSMSTPTVTTTMSRTEATTRSTSTGQMMTKRNRRARRDRGHAHRAERGAPIRKEW
jgi:hypothetical protein